VQPVLAVGIKDSTIQGFASIAAVERKAPTRDSLLNFIEEHPDTMRWAGLSDLKFPGVTNKLEGGNLTVRVDKFSFRIGGFLRGSGTFGLENEAVTFSAQARIKVKKVAEADLQIERDVTGGLKGKVELPVKIEKFNGNLIAAFENGYVDIKGRVKYSTKKLTGEVTLLVTDEETARNVAKQKLPPDQIIASATEATAPAGQPALARPGPRAMAGWGDLDFRFTPWLTGKATVIVDGDGNVTVVGEIAPPLRIEIFPQKDFVKQVFKIEARALYGVPVVGNIFVFANVGIDALAKFGPGTLYNMRIEGTYSTDPAVLDRFSISATLNISAFAGLRLRGEGGAGIEVLDHDIKAGVGVWALAGIRGYVEATPTIGYRELAAPVEGEEGQFFIKGHMELAAQPFLGLGGDLFVELDSPWWSPAPDKKWTWPLGQLDYPLPGAFGIGADVDYVIGSPELPEVQFTDVDFNAQKFMTDLMNDKVAPEGKGEEEKPGEWKEGEGAAGAEATSAEPGATDTQGAPAEGEAATGQQDPAAEGEPPDPAHAENWIAGLAAVAALSDQSKEHAFTEEKVDEELDTIKSDYGFAVLDAVRVGEDWGVEAEMHSKPSKKPASAPPKIEGAPPWPTELKDEDTPLLKQVAEEIDDKAPRRYVDGWKLHKKKRKKKAMELVAYVEQRSRFKLARATEGPWIDWYAGESGFTSAKKNTKTIQILGGDDPTTTRPLRDRIPDFWLDGQVVGDAKNVQYQSLDEQMRDNVLIADGTRARLYGTETLIQPAGRFDLIVRGVTDEDPEGTEVSGPLEDEIEAHDGEIYYYGEEES
jgi:hypothetical protein